MIHTLLIALHALGGAAALAVGFFALRPPTRGIPPAFRVYLAALCVMVLFLLGAVIRDWSTLTTGVRLSYSALVALALYTGWRGIRAFQDLRERHVGWTNAYLDDLGFTMIALFDGFVVVSTLDLGAPAWLVVAVGVAGVLLGRSAIMYMKKMTAAV